MTKFGIMEGRLVPPEDGRFQCFPRDQWESEFAHAAKVPFAFIEWIYDLYGHDVNPLGNPAGMDRLKKLSDSAGICIRSVCADYFMDKTSGPLRTERNRQTPGRTTAHPAQCSSLRRQSGRYSLRR